ncbi:MAG: hypothetical protein GTN36_01360 [Candidatus Aenigmarchaeota archaeon]|nr:hypothetical protein [Candidatus Aenigmarchaeota archaeon]
MNVTNEEKKDQPPAKPLPKWAIFLFFVVVIAFLVVAGFSLYNQLYRYKMAGTALRSGDVKGTAVLMAPEVGRAVREAERGLFT